MELDDVCGVKIQRCQHGQTEARLLSDAVGAMGCSIDLGLRSDLDFLCVSSVLEKLVSHEVISVTVYIVNTLNW